jgi:translocation and assembly module TamB
MRIMKIFIKSFLALFLIFVLLWIAALGILQTKQAQSWVLHTSLDYIEKKTGTHVEIGDIELVFPLTLRMNKVAFIQNQEKLMTIDKVLVTCSYGALLEGRLVFSTFHADGIHLIRMPLKLAQDSTESPPLWDGKPPFPFYVKIENLFLNNITIDPRLAEQMDLSQPFNTIATDSQFSIKGFISSNPFRQGITSHLNLLIEDPAHSSQPIKLILHAQRKFLSVTFEGNRLPKAATQYLSIDSKFNVVASAPITAWVSLLKDDILLHEQIDGRFKLALRPIDISSSFTPYLTDTTIVEGAFGFQKNKEFVLKEGSVRNALFELNGHANLDHDLGIQECQFKGNIKCLEKIHPLLIQNGGTEFSFKGAVKGSLESPYIALSAYAPTIKIKDQLMTSFNASFTSVPKNNLLDGSINVSFDFLQKPCQLTAFFNLGKDKLVLSELQADALDSFLTGHLDLSLTDYKMNGTLNFDSPHSEAWSFLLPYPVKGKAKVEILLSTPNGHQQTADIRLKAGSLWLKDFYVEQLETKLHMQAIDNTSLYHLQSNTKGEKVSWKNNTISNLTLNTTYQADLFHEDITNLKITLNGLDISLPEGKAEELSFLAELEHPLKEKSGRLSFTLQNVSKDGVLISHFNGESAISDHQSEWPFEFHANGFWNENWIADAEGHWHYDENALALNFNHLAGSLGPYPFKLLEPLAITQNHQNLNVEQLSLQLSDAILNASLSKENENLHCQFKTNRIPTELFHFIAPDFPLTGRVTVSGSLEGSINKPEGQLQVLLHHAQFSEEIFTQKPFMEGSVDLALHDKGIEVNSSLNGIGNTPVILKGTLPFILNLDPLELKLSSDTPFSLNLEAEGELDPYLHLFYNDITNLSGQTKIALNLSGQMNNPLIKGSIDLYNGSYESLDTGAIYNKIQARLEGHGSKVFLTNFIAHDNKNGSISATGEISIDKNNDFPFEFKINPSQIYVLESDYANISVSGPLTLSGTRKKAVLKGQLTTEDAIIHLEQALPKQIKHIDIQYINEQEGEHHFVHKNKKNNDFIELDIHLALPNKVMIEGKNLTSEWKGNIAFTGTPDEPLLNGDISVIKGEYNLNGKVFNLTQGNIHFAGPPAKKTTLYIIAGKDIDNIHAEIIVKGPANKPVLSFRSNPPLSQREVLSYILFNRGISDITQDQGDQLSQSFIELNDSDQSNKSNDLLTRLRNNIGIDRLDITSSDSNNKDVSLQVGKYITESVFVSINKSISDIGNRVAIEANLRKNLKAQAEVEVGGETQGKVSLKWKKDY